jgi:hypothetical protein
MNKETTNVFTQVWLADAAYADFSGIELIVDQAARDVLVRSRLRSTRAFGPTEADLFVAAWKVRQKRCQVYFFDSNVE